MDNSEVELELTFLARALPPEVEAAQPILMEDVYFPETVEHAHLRARRKNDKYEITKKSPVADGDASAHIEQTIPLTAEEYAALAAASQKRISKTRYNITLAGHDAEVDVFDGALEGLVLIDFEFESEADKAAFTPPEVCLADVTQEEFIAGGYLSGKSYEDIAPQLASFNYKPIR